MEIRQGDIFWMDPPGLEQGIPHPYVVVQADDLNRSLTTVSVCALTTNRKRISLPGNLLLEPGEGNLPRYSVVEVSRQYTVKKSRLGEYIGSLSRKRVEQILAGMRFVQRLMQRDGGESSIPPAGEENA